MTRQKRPKVRGFNPGSGQKRKHFTTREWRAISARQLERRSGALPVTLLQSCDLMRSQELALLRRVQHSPLTDQVPSPSIFTISSTFGLGSDLVRMSAGMSEVRRCTTSIRPLLLHPGASRSADRGASCAHGARDFSQQREQRGCRCGVWRLR